MSIKYLFAAVLVGAVTAITGITSAANSYTLFGNAEYVPGVPSGRAVKLPSTCPGGYPSCITNGTYTFGGVSFSFPSGTTFDDLDALSTDFMVESDDMCVGGAPRFSIGIDADNDGDRDGSIWAYFGTLSGSPACTAGTWQNTTDLLEVGMVLDTSQLAAYGGMYGDTYAAALSDFGSMKVTSITVVTDAGWADGDMEQTVFIDNTNVDGVIYAYDQAQTKNECKKGSWMNLEDDEGNTFKNQGDCVSFVATGGKNKGAVSP